MRFNEPFAVSPYLGLYLDMHGLIFETSICYWQDQPDIFPFTKRREAGLSRHILPPFPTRHLHVCLCPRCLSHGACHRTSFQSNSHSARTLLGNPIPRTDNRNPLRLNTGREYTSQPYTRNPLSLSRRRRESHQHSYPPGACLPAEAQTPHSLC